MKQTLKRVKTVGKLRLHLWTLINILMLFIGFNTAGKQTSTTA